MNVVALEAVVAAVVSGDVGVKALASASVSRLDAGAAAVAAVVGVLGKLRVVWRGEGLGDLLVELDLLFSLLPLLPLPFLSSATTREEVAPVAVSTLDRLDFPLISVPAPSSVDFCPSTRAGKIGFSTSVADLEFFVVFSSLGRLSSSREDPSSSDWEGEPASFRCLMRFGRF